MSRSRVDAACDCLRFDEIARLAALAASYYTSLMLAAEREEMDAIAVHLRQAIATTKAIVAIAGELQENEPRRPADADAANSGFERRPVTLTPERKGHDATRK
jgi:hypothetical protein